MTVAAAAVKSVTPAGTFVGRVQAVNTVNLVSRVEGFLQKRAFTEGQQVKTGDLLFVIEQDTYQAAVDQAQAQLASAQATERNAAIALQSPKNWSRPTRLRRRRSIRIWRIKARRRRPCVAPKPL